MAGRTGVAGYRWRICALLFFVTTVNYIDRQTLSLLNPTLKARIGWSDADFGYINAAFQLAYAIGMVCVGYLIDRLGTRRGFSLAILVWSAAAMLHAAARSAGGFALARFSLGLGEAANFPAGVKAVTEWFPTRERAIATGIFNSGTNIGATVAPIVVPALTIAAGWQWAFILTGALGLLALVSWLTVYQPADQHRRVSPGELAYIRSGDDEARGGAVPWLALLPHRETWAFMAGKFLTDPIWWFYLFWLPTFLHERFGLNLQSFGPPVVVVYVLADVGSVAGGWLSSRWIRRGRSVNFSRKTAMLICAVCVLPVGLATQVNSVWAVTLLVGLAAAAHQGWSCNLFTLASDMFPRSAVGSVVGLGGMTGALGGALFQVFVGDLVDKTHGNYFLPFACAASAYLIALAIIHGLTPRLAPAAFASERAARESA